MALHWGIADVEDWEEIAEGEEWQITHVIIFATMGLGLNKITEQNVDEWVKRIDYAASKGCYYMTGRTAGDIAIPREWIERRVGLWTNAETKSGAQYRSFVDQWAVNNLTRA